ncbi:hypothetical protein NDU88_002790 [Pleurodeles waltl]|uniref:Uncharacterized protein n=1 Tax=Pleurodeles waltl TaxID=8319 RepID=A0AAV7SE51_PLEWA|nr:hypothetical protein NDU88_002790 [Pleurodeles waltl]
MQVQCLSWERSICSASEYEDGSEQPRLMLDDPSVILTDKLTDTWNDRMKQLVTGLVGLINVEGTSVGKFVSVLISFFCPSSAVDIWELVKDQVEYKIDKKILAGEVT